MVLAVGAAGWSGRAGSWPLAAGVAYGGDQQIEVALVDAGQGVVETDGDSAGDACGQEEDAPFAAAGGQFAGVEGGDGCFPVGAGQQGDAVADAGAGGDEPAGEVPAAQPAAVIDH